MVLQDKLRPGFDIAYSPNGWWLEYGCICRDDEDKTLCGEEVKHKAKDGWPVNGLQSAECLKCCKEYHKVKYRKVKK